MFTSSNSTFTAIRPRCRRTRPSLTVLLSSTLAIAAFLATFTPTVAAQNVVTVVEIGSGALDRDLEDGPRRTRVNFDPLISGSHTLRVTWDGDADIRFAVFRVLDAPRPDDRVRIGTAGGSATPGEWTGALDASERYFLSVWAAAGSGNFVATIEAETTETTPLEIAVAPSDRTVTEGEDATFGVVATGGSGALTYQWLVDGTAIPDATGSELTLTAVTLDDSGTVYTVEVGDDADTLVSAGATLTVEAAPVLAITTPPSDRTVTEGENVVFGVVAAGGSGAITYRWLVDGTAIPGATGSELMAVAVTLDDSGTVYTVEVSDDAGATVSAGATLTVEAALAITTQPSDRTVTEGEDAVFGVVVTGGSGALAYRWLADGVAIPDATGSELTLTAITLDDSGTVYTVEVGDGDGTLVSAGATLTVEAAPVALAITSQPVDRAVAEGDDAVFGVVAAGGSGAITYRWLADGAAIPDATGSELTVAAVTPDDSGTVYTVEIGDGTDTIVSDGATLEVLPVTVVVVGQGTLDSAKAVGPRWVRLDFDSLASATHRIIVSWDTEADVRFNVFEADGTLIGSTVRGTNPGVWRGELEANERYYVGLWSADGVASYVATIEASVALAIASQPSDRTVTEGEDATFGVIATSSGDIGYQWFADGSPIAGETGDTLTVFSTSLAENGTEYVVEVSDGIDTVVSDVATLTVGEPLVLGLFSQRADSSTWMLDGPASTLDYDAGPNTDAWGRTLLRIDDVLLVGGDFQGIKPTRGGGVTARPFLAAFDAVSGQPVSTFRVPPQVDGVVRALVLSPDGGRVYAGGDFGLLILDAATGELDLAIGVTDGGGEGRVFDIAVTDAHLYVGGDFSRVDGTYRANVARLSLDGELDPSWSPNVTNGFSAGRSAPVQSLAVHPSGDTVYVGGNFRFVDGVPVPKTPQDKRISMLALSALDGTVLPERFIPNVGRSRKGVTAHDIAVTEFYVIVAWGGPNYLSFHSLSGDRLQQYSAKGDVQGLQVVGDHVFVGHHGEFFGSLTNPNPPEAVESIDPEILVPFKLHSFRIDDPSFLPEQAWKLSGTFGVWGVVASEDAIWVAGNITKAGSNDRSVEGLVRFSALE